MVSEVGLAGHEATREGDRRALSQPVDRSPLPRLYLALIIVITVGGLLLRLPSFNDSLAGDEISTFYIVVGHSLGRVMNLVYSRQETTPPLYFILAWVTKGFLGNPAQSIRLVSLLAGTAAIPLTFLLGLWTVGRRAALVAATLVAFSPYMIFYSTEARTYMLVLFTALLSSISLLRALDTNRPLWWVGYAASTCAAVYSHYSVVFFLVAQLVWAFWTQPTARRALVISNVAAGVGFLPWLGGLRADLAAPNLITRLVPVNVHDIDGILENFWIGHPIIKLNVLPGDLAVALAVAGLALGAFGLVLQWRKRHGPRWQIAPRVVLIIVLALAPAVLMILYSWLRVDVLGGGNMIASWPAMALAIGALVTAPARPFRVAAVTLTLAAFVIGGAKMLTSGAQRGNAERGSCVHRQHWEERRSNCQCVALLQSAVGTRCFTLWHIELYLHSRQPGGPCPPSHGQGSAPRAPTGNATSRRAVSLFGQSQSRTSVLWLAVDAGAGGCSTGSVTRSERHGVLGHLLRCSP